MSDGPSRSALPAAVLPFVDFGRLLHEHGFGIAPEQTIAFLRAIGMLGPRSLRDIYWAARATFGPEPERLGDFDALFDALFTDASTVGAIRESATEEDAPAKESGAGGLAPLPADTVNQSGKRATEAEALSLKRFAILSAEERLARLRHRLERAAPRRRGFRRVGAPRGDRLDLRRSLARLVRGDAGLARPAWTKRVRKRRRVLLLIDISGSMKSHTGDYLRFAHALTGALPLVECFSFGTRLTRLSRSLRHKDLERALAEIAPAVADWDGGTRIAASLASFLVVPRFSRASRGALVIVLSDGLERGEPGPMAQAVRRLAARSWRLAWLTPLAADPAFVADTAALKAILPLVDHLGDGGSIAALCAFIEGSARLGRRQPAAGRSGERHGHADHRRPPSHLAAGGPALADGADAAPHLRAL